MPGSPPPRSSPSLEGTLVACEEPRVDVLEVITAEYAALASDVGPENVLVLKRHPAGVDALGAALAAVDVESGGPHSPRVESLPEHASKVLEEHDPTLERLAYEERIELISLVIDGASRDVPPYLEQASDQDRFTRDVGQLLLEVTRQDVTPSTDCHPCLDFLFAMNDRFHAELESRGYVERAAVIPRTVALLEDDVNGLRARVTESFDAVLAVQFEECRQLDRRYLAALTETAELVCVGQRHASVERTRVEPGSLESVAPSLDVRIPADSGGTQPTRPLVRALATGTSGADGVDGRRSPGKHVNGYRLHAETARQQTAVVAAEINALCDRTDLEYGEIAVAVPAPERIPPTRRRLREGDVQTATVGTPSLADDPAVSELYAVILAQATLEAGGTVTDLESEVATRIGARASLDALERVRSRSVVSTLAEWIVETDCKDRIARAASWAEAREQFDSVERILEMARFVEATDLVAPDWDGLARMVRRAIEYDAPHVHEIETDAAQSGVAVCTVDDLAYDSRSVVFLLDCIDDAYPGSQFLTALFPNAWLRSMPDFPAVTDPSIAALETFATIADPASVVDRFERYHVERSRRRLALGASAATDRCYFCSFERELEGLRRTRAVSRFVRELEADQSIDLETVQPASSGRLVDGPNRTRTALLAEPWAELETLRRRASTGDPADLGPVEERFQELALVLEDDAVDETLREAVRTQFEFAAGEVRR